MSIHVKPIYTRPDYQLVQKNVYRNVRKAMRQRENEKLNSKKKSRHRCQNEYTYIAHWYEVNTNKTEIPKKKRDDMAGCEREYYLISILG